MSRLWRHAALLAAGVAVLVVAAALVSAPDDHAGPCIVQHAAVLSEIPEASGLAVSVAHPGVIWAHNDSGNDAVLFALDVDWPMRTGVVHLCRRHRRQPRRAS